MKVADLDFKARSVFVRKGKGNKQRLIVVPPEPMGYAREYVEKVRPCFAGRMKGGDDGTLFLNYTGARIEINGLCALIKKNAKLAKLDKHVTALTFRHSIASHLLENGMDIRFIQEMLGHAKMSTTQIYSKVTLTGMMKHYNKHHPREKRFRGTGGRTA
jgi:integrase/recombinase XerD